jgi:hypothetical protein
MDDRSQGGIKELMRVEDLAVGLERRKEKRLMEMGCDAI